MVPSLCYINSLNLIVFCLTFVLSVSELIFLLLFLNGLVGVWQMLPDDGVNRFTLH